MPSETPPHKLPSAGRFERCGTSTHVSRLSWRSSRSWIVYEILQSPLVSAVIELLEYLHAWDAFFIGPRPLCHYLNFNCAGDGGTNSCELLLPKFQEATNATDKLFVSIRRSWTCLQEVHHINWDQRDTEFNSTQSRSMSSKRLNRKNKDWNTFSPVRLRVEHHFSFSEHEALLYCESQPLPSSSAP